MNQAIESHVLCNIKSYGSQNIYPGRFQLSLLIFMSTCFCSGILRITVTKDCLQFLICKQDYILLGWLIYIYIYFTGVLWPFLQLLLTCVLTYKRFASFLKLSNFPTILFTTHLFFSGLVLYFNLYFSPIHHTVYTLGYQWSNSSSLSWHLTLDSQLWIKAFAHQRFNYSVFTQLLFQHKFCSDFPLVVADHYFFLLPTYSPLLANVLAKQHLPLQHN